MPITLSQRSTVILVLILFGLALLIHGWWYFRPKAMRSAGKSGAPPGTTPRQACTIKEAFNYASQLRLMADAEEQRAWMDDSHASRQAAWLMAKAKYAVTQFEAVKEPATMSEKVRFLLEDTYWMLLLASHQSRQGVQDIQEEKGARLRAFISPIDQTFQTYSLTIPKAYDPTVTWPLIVSMHGHGWFRPFQGHPAPTYAGAFCVAPQGRGATDYKDIGEVDVLAAIEEIKRDYRIDPNRVYLTGSSMGGTGAFHLGTRYADQFAAIFPIVGNADNQVWSRRWGWNRYFSGRFNDLRQSIQESHTARAYASNLINLPTYIISGSGDTVVPPEHSRRMADAMRAAGCTVEYREYPAIGHGGFPKTALEHGLAWTCGWTRRAFPARVFWQASQLRHGRAYWLRFEQLEQPLRPGTIDARAGANNQLVITTDNLLAFSLQRPYTLFQPGAAVNLTIDSASLTLPGDRPWNDWLTLRKDPIHGWNLDSIVPEPPLLKKRGCEGPIQDVLLDPFLLVVGTQAVDFTMREAWLREAKAFVAEWQRRQGGSCRMILDTQCTAELMSKYHLILWGGAEDNLISRQLLQEVPLPEIMTPLRANQVNLEADDVGSMIVYPNLAGAPDRLAVFLTANSPRAAFQLWGRFGNWFNWGVYDSKKYFDYAVFDSRSATPETMLLLGWFGSDWQVETGRWFRGNDELRQQAIPQGFPPFSTVPAGANQVLLTELMPLSIDQMRGAVGFDRDFFGEPLPLAEELPGGLGLRAPCTIEYDLEQHFQLLTCYVALTNPKESELSRIRERGEAIRFTIYGDKRKLAETTLNWKTPSKPLAADVNGVKLLKLEVVPAGGPAWLHMGSAWLGTTLHRQSSMTAKEWSKNEIEKKEPKDK